ncbi:MAG: LarC family nickel insertion protein [Armatimonadetes bacterium]|nr:LarC family nickel insertion protein [Armatimonadota bacterium]MDE2205965.1 LarC family nickel insertion protein [Armatimonadota bacterium]
MRIGVLDCFSGVSGDMLLGALLHCGVEQHALEAQLRQLNVPGWSLHCEHVLKEGISGVRAGVLLEERDEGHGRRLSDIESILASSSLPVKTVARAVSTFRRLAGAEARIHGATVDDIHFHEVGAVDAIIDITGACIGFDLLGIERLYVTDIPMNRGWIECAHGTMPSPAPAALELLAGFVLRPDERRMELVTPTGAAVLAEFAVRDPLGGAQPPPVFRLELTGYGAGQRDTWIPNLLRMMIGEEVAVEQRVPSGGGPTSRKRPHGSGQHAGDAPAVDH